MRFELLTQLVLSHYELLYFIHLHLFSYLKQATLKISILLKILALI